MRGEPDVEIIVYEGSMSPKKPVITVEAKGKWYDLVLIGLDGKLSWVEFPDMGDYGRLGSPYVDHTPSPWHVVEWAENRGYEVCHLALEMMIGRWELECGRERYDSLFDPANRRNPDR